MKALLNLEELAKVILTYLGSLWLGFDWWMFFVLVLLPDLSMIGYTFNAKLGAYIYNLAHHQAIAIVVFIVGYYLNNDWMMLSGLVLLGHSAMDRMFGYGLKYPDSFKHTHMNKPKT